ncbi:glycosyltransferase family 4 protein [Exiguobacterium sp. K1]|uniref:glycosyltransferase family 4 protein n=1 Tax=Exiguobacterium sp. K1 TaxID=2980105 RepID=UPI00299D3FA1|nr:glycosyltransferase family 4 protein [Exiguobacterium sp. K1]MDX1259796.1 glycosyltransferase family 4 protein [Exiguobacterium sp. K1]
MEIKIPVTGKFKAWKNRRPLLEVQKKAQTKTGPETMNVLMICQNFYPEIGSAANRMKNIFKRMEQQGSDVHVLTSEPLYPTAELYTDAMFWDEPSLDAANITRIQPRDLRATTNLWRRLRLFLEQFVLAVREVRQDKKQYSYIYATTPSIFMGLVGVVAKFIKKAPLVLDVRDLWPESLVGVGITKSRLLLAPLYWLEKWMYHRADQIVINSEGFRSYIESKGISPEKIHYIPNSIEENEWLIKRRKVSEQVRVVYTGNIGLAQDVFLLLDVAERLKEDSKIEFHVVGYGYHKEKFEEHVLKRGLTNIHFMNAMPRWDALKQLAKSDIAFATLVESTAFDTVTPGKIIDYMAMGCAIVGAVSGHAAKVIEEAGAGFVSRERCRETIVGQIRYLAEHPEAREEMGQSGVAYVQTHFDWEQNQERLFEAIQKTNIEAVGVSK